MSYRVHDGALARLVSTARARRGFVAAMLVASWLSGCACPPGETTMASTAEQPARANNAIAMGVVRYENFLPEEFEVMRAATRLAEIVLRDPEFREAVARIARFAHQHPDEPAELRDDTGADVLARLARTPDLVLAGVCWPLARAHARHVGEGRIEINRDHLGARTLAMWTATLVHELCHVAGYTHRPQGRTPETRQSVPYRLDALAWRRARQLSHAPRANSTDARLDRP